MLARRGSVEGGVFRGSDCGQLQLTDEIPTKDQREGLTLLPRSGLRRERRRISKERESKDKEETRKGRNLHREESEERQKIKIK